MNAFSAGKCHVIHNVITKDSPFPCTAKFILVGVRNYKTQQIRS